MTTDTQETGLIASKIAQATTRTLDVTVSLRGDLRDRYDRLTEEIAQHRGIGAERLGDEVVARLEAERREVQAEAAESALTFTLVPVSTTRGRVVQARVGKDAEQSERLLALARVCIRSPKPTDAEWQALMHGVTRPAGDDDDPDDIDEDGNVFVPPLVAGGDQADLMMAANDLVYGNSKSVPTLPGASAASREPSTN